MGYMKWLLPDFIPETEGYLLDIARRGLKAPLPDSWKPCKTTDTEEIYYFNFATGESSWDHPCDMYYKKEVERARRARRLHCEPSAERAARGHTGGLGLALGGGYTFVDQASSLDRASASMRGYLLKDTSTGRWQRRWFEIMGRFFVYYKTQEDSEMLCAMDLRLAKNIHVVVDGVVPVGTGPAAPRQAFSLCWDKKRTFLAETRAEAEAWVEALRAAQSAPVSSPLRVGALPAATASTSTSAASGAADEPSADGLGVSACVTLHAGPGGDPLLASQPGALTWSPQAGSGQHEAHTTGTFPQAVETEPVVVARLEASDESNRGHRPSSCAGDGTPQHGEPVPLDSESTS